MFRALQDLKPGYEARWVHLGEGDLEKHRVTYGATGRQNRSKLTLLKRLENI
jgi:hypothetical protein